MNRGFEKALVSFLRDTTNELRKAREEAHAKHPELFTNMTHQQKLEAVRQACIKAGGVSYEKVEEHSDGTYIAKVQPIRLADVLSLMHGFNESRWISANTDGELLQHDGIASDVCVAKWNLRKDSLDEQSEETISFLYDALK